MTDAVIVFCTCASQDQAVAIANTVLEERLAACVNVLPPIRSIYRWEDKIEDAQEMVLLIKTTAHRFAALRDRITELHSYDTPEIIAVPVEDGSARYLAWLREQV